MRDKRRREREIMRGVESERRRERYLDGESWREIEKERYGKRGMIDNR